MPEMTGQIYMFLVIAFGLGVLLGYMLWGGELGSYQSEAAAARKAEADAQRKLEAARKDREAAKTEKKDLSQKAAAAEESAAAFKKKHQAAQESSENARAETKRLAAKIETMEVEMSKLKGRVSKLTVDAKEEEKERDFLRKEAAKSKDLRGKLEDAQKRIDELEAAARKSEKKARKKRDADRKQAEAEAAAADQGSDSNSLIADMVGGEVEDAAPADAGDATPATDAPEGEPKAGEEAAAS